MVFFNKNIIIYLENLIKYFHWGYYKLLAEKLLVYLSLMGNIYTLNLNEQPSVIPNKNVIFQFMDSNFNCNLKIQKSYLLGKSKVWI